MGTAELRLGYKEDRQDELEWVILFVYTPYCNISINDLGCRNFSQHTGVMIYGLLPNNVIL